MSAKTEETEESEVNAEKKKEFKEILIELNELKANSEIQKRLANLRIGFVGAGKLTQSITTALILHANISSSNIFVSAKSGRNLELFQQKGCSVTKRNYDIFGRFDCDIVFLTFYGSLIKQCYRLGSANRPIPFTSQYIPIPNRTIHVLSLVSGVTLDEITECLIKPDQLTDFPLKVHRIVLNTSVVFGPKAGLCAIDVVPEVFDSTVQYLLSKISDIEHIPESEMDAFCCLAGNGLPIGYYFCEALVQSAIALDLKKSVAIRLSALVMQCAANIALKSDRNALQLVENCNSSSALTGIQVFKDWLVESTVESAVEAVFRRAEHMSQFITTNKYNY